LQTFLTIVKYLNYFQVCYRFYCSGLDEYKQSLKDKAAEPNPRCRFHFDVPVVVEGGLSTGLIIAIAIAAMAIMGLAGFAFLNW